MSWKPIAAPVDVKKAVADHIEAFLMAGDPSPSNQNLLRRYWQQVFALRLEDLAKANGLDKNKAADLLKKSREAGWRYLIGTRAGQALYATVDSANRMTGLSRGTKVSTILQAAVELRTLPEAADGEYELRVLTIP